jgi:hypothetical protein
MKTSLNPAAAVDAPIARRFYIGRYWRRATAQHRSATTHTL